MSKTASRNNIEIFGNRRSNAVCGSSLQNRRVHGSSNRQRSMLRYSNSFNANLHETSNRRKMERDRADFLTLWNLLNCVEAIDGKHITIQAPPNSGSVYFNYKKTFNIVLMAACDARCRFTLFDVGAYGSDSDGGILSRTAFGKSLYEGTLNLPRGTARLPGSDKETPCYFVDDEAFQMSVNMMRPYSGRALNDQKRIFNYRLSRARRTIENTFGILAARWRILRRPITAGPEQICRQICASNNVFA